MPNLDPRGRNITRAINGPAATYAIARHDRLYLHVLGGGRASWRIRYRPKPNANQRWFTLSDDARHADFEKIATKAHDLLTNLRLHGIDPLTEQEKNEREIEFTANRKRFVCDVGAYRCTVGDSLPSEVPFVLSPDKQTEAFISKHNVWVRPKAACAVMPAEKGGRSAGCDSTQLTTDGVDYWSYGVEANRHTLEYFFKQHHAQGLSSRLVKPEDLFHPGTLESFKL